MIHILENDLDTTDMKYLVSIDAARGKTEGIFARQWTVVSDAAILIA